MEPGSSRTASTRPPIRLAITLSQGGGSDATRSPSSAKGSSASSSNGSGRSAFTASAAATADAADPPMPAASGTPLSIESRTPNETFAASRSEEHTSELQSLMRISYAVFCLKQKHNNKNHAIHHIHKNY